MVTRDSAWLPGTPCWVDVMVDDVSKATAFYGALFGWEAAISQDPMSGGYGNFSKDGRPVAGVAPSQQPGQPQVWTTYLASDDLEQTAGKIKGAGGQVLFDPMNIGEFGRMIVAADPAGAVFGVWQSGTHTGFRLANVPGSVIWNENMSRDAEGNKKFYGEVFGYGFGDMSGDGHSYFTLDLGGRSVAGVGQMDKEFPPEIPANWTTYFAVEDTDATVAKAVSLGGKVVKEAFDSPQGRIAFLADDQGASFAILTVTG
jgi:predicted enzyme related to lactoylglutathione lyase